ncbi:GAF domain-containing protein [Pseudoduganella sp. FT25W]|uniref:histidine kinase n=1 Tax=Duganella alba TaxID=2666081 RepID=A0A6L5QLP7_9BURK|nr:ATP-binding protein [Duganella alba]MRX10680.1 GAF domain-containing protein [Duganella alba]MRX18678.1 GAF domain-containing protein [Duganella alba]
MDMFALDDALAEWEAALPSLRGAARLPLLLPLAWHLRQRDTGRALQMADEAEALLPAAALSPDETGVIAARLHLVRAEASWLSGQLQAADALALQAGERCAALHHHPGRADAHWLRAWIAIDSGDHARAEQELEQMAAAARDAGDRRRCAIADAVNARWAVLRDLSSAQQRWAQRFTAEEEELPGVASWIYDYYGLAASQASDFGAAAGHYLHCYEAALETGQMRMAITAAINIGLDFTTLNDHHAALEWMETALDLARPTGWPRSIGACLTHTADTMRRLGRLDATAELLREAVRILAPLSGARSYATALQYLGDLSLDQGEYPAALDAFRKLEARGDALGHADFQSIARRGQAHALCFLDRPQEAMAAAGRAAELAQAQADRYNHVAALRVISLIHLRHQLPAPAGMTEPNATLHFLHQALAAAGHINGYTLPADLHDALAREYAHIGDYRKAYEAAQEAASAREKTHSQDATNRAIAMQVQHQTENTRAEGFHHRELAASEARRIDLLQQTQATLERLSAIGQEITTHLDAGAVFQALDRHVQALLPANSLAIYMCDPGCDTISRVFGIENGQPLASNTIEIDNPRANAARSLRERTEIYVADAGPDDIFLAPGTQLMASALYVPLLVGERILGVMTVQSTRANAYGERERLIFRTLCAYGAIALDNAEAYRQLKDAQTQLVSQEKLAALGALMAGVAHELNTPIGNSLLIASTLLQKTEELEQQMNGSGLKRSSLATYLEDARKAHELVMRGLTSAANLVNSFKQVAVDRTTEQRREFNLWQVSQEVIATMMNRIRAANHRIELEMPDTIVLDSYPGPYGQVIANFINNALLHAFAREGSGSMWLRAHAPVDGRVQVTFRDNGSGIAPEHMSRIFDPFFTTKLGQGGSGLGLSISYNIVTSLMGGLITVHSSREGTTFTLDLPLTAPENKLPSTTHIYH